MPKPDKQDGMLLHDAKIVRIYDAKLLVVKTAEMQPSLSKCRHRFAIPFKPYLENCQVTKQKKFRMT